MVKYITAFLVVVLMSGCGGGGGSQGSTAPDRISEINQLIVNINQLNSDNKVVVSYGLSDGDQVFEFSDGSSELEIEDALITSLSENESLWQLEIRFSNAESATLNLQPVSLSITSDNITLNPAGFTPLSAEANFNTPFPGQIRVTVPGRGVNGISLGHTFSRAGTNYQIPIHGLYQDYANPVQIQFLDVSGNLLSTDEITISTAPLSDAPTVNIVTNDLPASEDKLYMEVGLKHAFDQTGAFRWVYSGGDANQVFERLSNGNWLVTNSTDNVIYHWPMFNEMDMFGNFVATYNVPNLGHHEVVRMTNGNFLIAGNSEVFTQESMLDENISQEDVMQEISSETGEVIAEYDFNELLDPTRDMHVGLFPGDWLHINAAYEDSEDNSIVVSGRHQAAVVKVSRTDGELVWILAPHELWPEALQPYLLTPVDGDGDPLDITNINFWPYGQHAVSKLSNGNILLYDNGNERGYYKEVVQSENLYSRVVEYRVDAENMTVEKVWEYDYARSFYTITTGDVDYLPDTGGRLISFVGGDGGSVLPLPRVVELDDQDNIVFEYVINEGTTGYRTTRFDLYENVE